MTDIRFENLASLHWLWLLLAVAAVVVVAFSLRRRRMLRFATAAVLGRLVPAAASSRRVVRVTLVLAAMFLLVVGLLDPRWGVSYDEVRQEGIDIFVALDVSRSMLAQDARPSRLERARLAALDLVDKLGGDRIGLITFAGKPTVSCPLTIDYGAFALALAEADPRWAPKGGSNLGDALRLAGESFTDDVRDHKAVIVFTDGEDHDSYPVEAASRLYEEHGIRVYTVGLGDADEGARIPVPTEGGVRFLRHDGREVWSVMDATLLRDVALSAGGAFIPVGTSAVDLGRVYEERIAPATGRQFGTSRVKRYHVKYQWFAAIALALLIVESIVSDRGREVVA